MNRVNEASQPASEPVIEPGEPAGEPASEPLNEPGELASEPASERAW